MSSFLPPRGCLIAASALVALVGTPAATPADPPTCHPGFPLVMTLSDALVRYDGYYTVEEIRAGFADHDKNGNGYWCYRLSPDDKFFPLVFFRDDLEGLGAH
jgi:hypothetical protein